MLDRPLLPKRVVVMWLEERHHVAAEPGDVRAVLCDMYTVAGHHRPREAILDCVGD